MGDSNGNGNNDEGDRGLREAFTLVSSILSALQFETRVQALLATGYDVNRRLMHGETILHFTCEHYYPSRVLEMLIAHGGNVNAQSNIGWTPLHNACRGCHMDKARMLMDHGAQVDMRCNEGTTPLYMACFHDDNSELVRFLIANGADVNVQDTWRLWTPLHITCDKGHLDTASLLVTNGAQVNVADNNGETSLHSACWRGHLEIVQLLLSRGADVNIEDIHGRTPLHCASLRNHLEVVWLLVPRYFLGV